MSYLGRLRRSCLRVQEWEIRLVQVQLEQESLLRELDRIQIACPHDRGSDDHCKVCHKEMEIDDEDT